MRAERAACVCVQWAGINLVCNTVILNQTFLYTLLYLNIIFTTFAFLIILVVGFLNFHNCEVLCQLGHKIYLPIVTVQRTGVSWMLTETGRACECECFNFILILSA